MSSHHFVKEAQEPALLVQSVPNAYTMPEVLGSLLEWSPIVACSINAAPQLLEWGIKVDAVYCGELEAGNAQKLVDTYQQFEILVAVRPINAAISWIKNKDGKAINCFTTEYSRVPTQLSQELPIVYYTPNSQTLTNIYQFEKWVSEEVRFSVLAEQVHPLEVSNLVFDSQSKTYSPIKTGLVKISASQHFSVTEHFFIK